MDCGGSSDGGAGLRDAEMSEGGALWPVRLHERPLVVEFGAGGGS